jgi:hypothetical protein
MGPVQISKGMICFQNNKAPTRVQENKKKTKSTSKQIPQPKNPYPYLLLEYLHKIPIRRNTTTEIFV